MTVATNVSGFSPQLRPDRSVIRIMGDGALAFLHNLLTADLTTSEPAYAALLSPQGKILHDVFVVPQGEIVWIDVANVQAEALLKRLMMYRLRAKLEMQIAGDKAIAVGPLGSLPGLVYADPRVKGLGARAIVEMGSLVTAAGYDAARIASGIGDSVLDIGSGELFPHEANLDQLHGVNFHKGCYVGQEVVSRTHHRHTARNRILPVTFSETVANGTEIMSGDKRIGTMLSSQDKLGLALVRLDRLAEAEVPLLSGAVTVKVHKPAWAQFEMAIPEILQ